jgi:hypothetical protein
VVKDDAGTGGNSQTCLNYHCQYCGEMFGEKLLFQNHIVLEHFSFQPFQCEDCDMEFERGVNLVLHATREHGKSADSCMQQVGEKEDLQCPYCCKVLTGPYLIRHLDKDHADQFPLTCTDCSLSFFDLHALNKHAELCEKVNIKSVQLLVIDNEERSANVVVDGENSAVTDSGATAAAICLSSDQAPVSVSNVRPTSNMYIVESAADLDPVATDGKPLLYCDICLMAFVTIYRLKRHRKEVHLVVGTPGKTDADDNTIARIHQFVGTVGDDAPRYSCDHCSKTIAHVTHLRRHLMSVHGLTMDMWKARQVKETGTTDEKPVGNFCDMCDKVFKRMVDLKRHTEVVHMKKKYQYRRHIPSKRVSRSKVAGKAAIRLVKSAHVCSICDKAFTRNSNLMTHMKRVHPSTVITADSFTDSVWFPDPAANVTVSSLGESPAALTTAALNVPLVSLLTTASTTLNSTSVCTEDRLGQVTASSAESSDSLTRDVVYSATATDGTVVTVYTDGGATGEQGGDNLSVPEIHISIEAPGGGTSDVDTEAEIRDILQRAGLLS